MRLFVVSLFLLFQGLETFAQILDDTTKEIYSHKTVKFRYESNMLSNRKTYTGDTSLIDFSQRGDFLYQGNQIYQNLGVFGTSARPLFYRLPGSIGLRYGMNMFDYLIPGLEQIKYFNTLSPYTEAQYTQGAKQRSSFRITMAQNILPRLNIAAHYQRFTALRILNVTQTDERLTDHHSAWLSGNYTSNNKKYQVWAYYQHLNQLQYETGGGISTSPGKIDSLFISPDLMGVNLFSDARNRELRNNWYASQVWKPFGKGLFFRTSHVRNKQINTYVDPKPNPDFYGSRRVYFQSQTSVPGKTLDTLFSERQHQLLENTIYGGYQDSLNEYSFYLKRRDTDYRTNIFTILQKRTEILYGFLYQGVLGGGDAIIKTEFISNKEYDINLSWTKKNLKVEARRMVFTPSLIQREFFSKNLVYSNQFQSSPSLNLKVDYALKLKNWTIAPGFEHIVVDKGIVIDTTFLPYQETRASTMQYASIRINGQLGKLFYTENRFIRVFQAGSRVSQMPSYVYHSAHYFDILRKKKGFSVQLGFNLDWRFDWPSENYNPLTGQWFLQNYTTIPPYFLLDFFAHFKIDRARIYAKVHNTLQKVGGLGYFAAPYYPAQRRLFEVGLIWTFFD